MNDETSSNGNGRSWLERLGQVISGEPRDREDLLTVLRDAATRELLDADVLAMIEGALQVSDMQVRDVMVPRAQMVTVSQNATPEELLDSIVDSGHSRFPVTGEGRDEVVGILLAKNLLQYYRDGEQLFDLNKMVQTVPFVPESKRLNVLLNEFRDSRKHMALVVDEYGGVAGLVTIEDVLEQIVGNIDDEHDTGDEPWIQAQTDTRFTVNALTPVDEFNAHFETRLDDDDCDTIGGLLVNELGRVPGRGETVNLDTLHFKVLRADNRRVHWLQLDVGAVPGGEA